MEISLLIIVATTKFKYYQTKNFQKVRYFLSIKRRLLTLSTKKYSKTRDSLQTCLAANRKMLATRLSRQRLVDVTVLATRNNSLKIAMTLYHEKIGIN